MSIIKKLYKDGHLSLGQSFATETHYETIMGSVAYGASDSDKSDMDIHAICTPPLEYVFPWLSGWIPDFDNRPQNFENFQQHHIKAYEKDYDVAIYSTIRTFRLAAENNPNILDMLWVPDNCITHIDGVGHHIRRNRKLFLHKGSLHRFLGYAHQQMKRLKTSNRVELIEKYGYDTKFAYHIVRLSLQVEQILEKHDMDFSANAPFIKEVRKGAFKTAEELEAWYREKEVHLNALYHTSTLRHSPDMAQLKEVLMACLEMKYGSLEKVYKGAESDVFRKLEEIKRIVNS